MTIEEIYGLIDRFEGSTLHSLKLSMDNTVLELGRSTAPAAAPECPVPMQQQVEEDSPSIQAPLVGTFYAAASPDSAPFVQLGDTVKKGQTVCLIEAMKMISEIPAPCDCVITRILVDNGALVGFHQPLFHYKPC